jgi:hypothetical protein
MTGVAYENDLPACCGMVFDFAMYLRNQGAGRIDDSEPTLARFLPNLGRNAMRTENGDCPIWNFIKTLHEHCPLCCQLIDYKSIVDNLFPNINRAAQSLQCDRDNVDGTNYPGAETAWLG